MSPKKNQTAPSPKATNHSMIFSLEGTPETSQDCPLLPSEKPKSAKHGPVSTQVDVSLTENLSKPRLSSNVQDILVLYLAKIETVEHAPSLIPDTLEPPIAKRWVGWPGTPESDSVALQPTSQEAQKDFKKQPLSLSPRVSNLTVQIRSLSAPTGITLGKTELSPELPVSYDEQPRPSSVPKSVRSSPVDTETVTWRSGSTDRKSHSRLPSTGSTGGSAIYFGNA